MSAGKRRWAAAHRKGFMAGVAWAQGMPADGGPVSSDKMPLVGEHASSYPAPSLSALSANMGMVRIGSISAQIGNELHTHYANGDATIEPRIGRELMGEIIDEVFGGAHEDDGTIREIYAVIKKHEAAKALAAERAAELENEACHVCGICLSDGDPVYWSDDGFMHADCLGPERECYFNADERALVEGEAIPRPLIWTKAGKGYQLADDTTNDNACVDRFAKIMKAKLAADRAKGRDGWDKPELCTIDTLSDMLIGHIAKGDPVDVANFAMMIHQRGSQISTPKDGNAVLIGLDVAHRADVTAVWVENKLFLDVDQIAQAGRYPFIAEGNELKPNPAFSVGSAPPAPATLGESER
ncbi:hypothetical protein ACRQ1B_28825 [Rhizobium panacihumi]|uniref:hypothetical protein n=1 Tax=Rhizobium panacihumi TaxID=2008450 RepID=UPI003D78D701